MRKFFLTLTILFLLSVLGVLGVHAQDDMLVLAYGQMIDGSLNADQPSAFYAFDALRNDVITITMEVTGGEIDPFLVLNDSARRPLITDDNSGGGVNARLTFVIPGDGRYIIQSTHAGGGLAEITGTFRLTLTSAGFEGEPVLVDPAAVQPALPTPTPAGESTPVTEPAVESTPAVSDAPVEQGDSTRLVALTSGSRINDTLTRQTPLRFYWFEAGEGDQVTLTPEPLGAFQPLLILYNASFAEIQRSADGTALTASFDTDGIYFVSVSVPAVTSEGGDYGFSFDLRGNLAQEGNFIDVLYGQSQQGTIDNNIPAVTYRFFGSAGDNVTISMSRVGGDLDSYLYLFDSNGQPLFEDNDSGGTDGNARIVFSLPADGAYLIMATRLGQTQGTTSGSYLLDLLSDAAPPVVQPTAAPTLPADYADFPTIAYDQTVEGQITAAKFLEVYVFEGKQDDTILVEMNSQNSEEVNGLDPMIILLDDSRIPLIENDDIVDGEVRDSRIEFTLPKTGYYAIVATRFDQENGTSEGGYSLTLTGPGSFESTPENETPVAQTPVTRIPSTALEPSAPLQAIFDQPVTAYTFNAAANVVIDLTMTTDPGVDSVLILADQNLNEVLSSGTGELAGITIPADGEYLVLVAPRFGPVEAAGSGYILALSGAGETGEPETATAEVIEGPQPINLGQTVRGVIDDTNVSIIYTFSGTAGTQVRITMEAVAGSTLDCYMELQSADGTVIDANDDIDPGVVRNSQLVVELPADGEYQILASRYVGPDADITSGAFDLTLENVTGQDITPLNTDMLPLSYGESATGEVNDEQYLLFYVFDGTAGDIVTIQIDNLSGNLDSVLYLYQSSTAGWVKMAENDDSPTGATFDALLSNIVLPVTGKYLIATGRYDLETGTTSGTFSITLSKQ